MHEWAVRHVEGFEARSLDEPAVARKHATACTYRPVAPRRLVRPNDDLAAVSAVSRVGTQGCVLANVRSLRCVRSIGTGAIAPDENLAATRMPRGVEDGVVRDGHVVAKYLDRAANTAFF